MSNNKVAQSIMIKNFLEELHSAGIPFIAVNMIEKSSDSAISGTADNELCTSR